MDWKRSAFEPHPVGVFAAVLVDWEETSNDYGDQVALKFDSEELMQDGQPYRVTLWVKPILNPKSKAYATLQAFGVPVDTVDPAAIPAILDALVERNAPIRLGIKEYTRQDGTKGTKIDSLYPLKQPAAKPTPSTGTGSTGRKEQPALLGAGAIDPFDQE